jgi:hypothetical protein
MNQRITDPTADDIQRLATQLVVVRELSRVHLGRELCQDESDLDALQDLLDRGVLKPEQTYELQCLGVVFGWLLVDALGGVDWCIVEDEYGRDPALRYLSTSMLVFPLTMISKRVEDGQRVVVRELFEGVCHEVDKLRGELGPS